MNKYGILNSSIAKVLADLGHTDKICIGDCGLPVPNGVEKIDLALRFGEPLFIEVVKAVGSTERSIPGGQSRMGHAEGPRTAESNGKGLQDCHQDRRSYSFLQYYSPVRSHLLREESEVHGYKYGRDLQILRYE